MYSSMIVSFSRKNRFWFWGMMVAAVLTAYSAICPYICASAQAGEKSAHSCCPKSSQQNQESKNHESPQCCDQHDHVILKEISTANSSTLTFKSVFVIVQNIHFISLETPSIFDLSGGPPFHLSDQPLYLIQNALLI